MGTCAGLCAMPTGLRRGQTLLARFGVYDERSAGLTGVGFLQNSNWGYRNQKGSWWIGFRTTRSSITGLRIWLKLKQPMVWWQSHLKKLIWPAGACWHLGPQLILGWGLLFKLWWLKLTKPKLTIYSMHVEIWWNLHWSVVLHQQDLKNIGLDSQDFIYLVLMAWWLKSSGLFAWHDCGEGLDVIEFFSGVGRIAKFAHARGFESRAYDINHDDAPIGESTHSQMPRRSAFDLNGEAGFL